MEFLKGIIHWLTHDNSTPLGSIALGVIGYIAVQARLGLLKVVKRIIPKIKDFNSKHIKRDKKLNAVQLANVAVKIGRGEKVKKWEKRAYDRQVRRIKKVDEEIKKREA